MDCRPLAGLLLVALLLLPTGSAAAAPNGTAPDDATRAFMSDDRDPEAGTLPPFVLPGIQDAIRAENISIANISQMRDFAYATTQPPHRVGSNQQTVSEYRLAQLRSIQRNKSTSLWLPDSNRSNGTVVKDAHITILGTTEGTHTRLGSSKGNQTGNASNRLMVPRTGSVLAYLDYSTLLPNRTCTVAGETRTCLSYTLLDQQVERSVQIGNQTWSGDAASPRQLEYTDASATGPTTMQVHATINSTVAVQTTTYVSNGGGWQLANTTASDALTLSHTVRDRAPVIVTSNQDLNVTQAVVRSEGGIDQIILQFKGPQTLSERRLWSYARFNGSVGRVRNVWSVHSQRRYANATRGHRLLMQSNTTVSLPGRNTIDRNYTLPAQFTDSWTRQENVSFPNVLEQQLTAERRQPTLRWTQQTNVASAPEITRVDGFQLSDQAAPLDRHVNLTSVPPRGTTTIVITNVDQPITEVRDIHNDSIPLETRTVPERNATLATTTLNETHARIQLTDATTDQPLPGRMLWLSGAAQGRMTTNGNGAVVVERRDLYVTASYPGATNVSQGVYYGPAEARVAFQPEPFNIYQLLTSLAGALVSVVAFLVFFLPFAYLRRGTEETSS